ncbi:MAG: Mini-ribonuclease 3 [Tenericutes bacterium]|nr:Mini-ribonuclease 3 [Mycoplasmatota bacterium]
MNGLTLAYIGDAYYELSIRTYLINQKLTNVNDLHKKAIRFTSGKAQSVIMNYLINEKIVSEQEIDLFKRGRNSSGPGRKNIDAQTYHYATGFEALIGSLYLDNKTRADELIKISIEYIEKGDFDGKNS